MENQEKGSMLGICNSGTTERNNMVQKQSKREDNEKKTRKKTMTKALHLTLIFSTG